MIATIIGFFIFALALILAYRFIFLIPVALVGVFVVPFQLLKGLPKYKGLEKMIETINVILSFIILTGFLVAIVYTIFS